MEMVAYLVNQNTKLILTTHSPYILYTINNFLMANKVLVAGKNLPEGISTEVALKPSQVTAYRFGQDGAVHQIMADETGLIDEQELDQVAEDLGATFVDLQELLGGWDA